MERDTAWKEGMKTSRYTHRQAEWNANRQADRLEGTNESRQAGGQSVSRAEKQAGRKGVPATRGTG